MAAKRHREETINTQLAVLLARYGVQAEAETILAHGTERPDVLFELRGLRVAIEGKFEDHPKARDAVFGDASGRVQTGIAQIAAAVVYPSALRTSPTIELLDRLETASLIYRIVSETGETEWSEGDAASLMNSLRRAQETLAEDDIVEKTAESLEAQLEVVSQFWLGQPTACDRLSGILGMVIPKKEKADEAAGRRVMAAKVSALVIANALIFQEQLAATNKMVNPLHRLEKEKDPVSEARKHWIYIWENINYVPIFQLGERVLGELTINQGTITAIHRLLKEAKNICTRQSALRHDLMGRIYHWLLQHAKYLGTFYTSVSAATLLLKLTMGRDWDRDFGDPAILEEFKAADFACGTGTLLMATAQALSDAFIRERAASGKSLTKVDLKGFHRAVMERILYGYDVLPSAVHLTASTLALLAPEVAFGKMNLFVMPLGVHGGVSQLGSLDFLTRIEVWTQLALDQSHAFATRKGAGTEFTDKATAPKLDLCVMNPPFVRSVGGNLLFGSLPEKERKALQDELKKRVRNVEASITAGLGSVFVALADNHLKIGGRLAFVLPHALTSGEAWSVTRKLIADHYHLEMVISSHDAERPNFSENTDLSEILFIARKLDGKEPVGETTYVSLWKNPTSIHEALDLAERIKGTKCGIIGSQSGSRGEIFQLPAAKGTENWHGALFSRGTLAQASFDLGKGTLNVPGQLPVEIRICRLTDLGELGYDRRDIHDAFTMSEDAWSLHPAFWNHKADRVTSIHQGPNAWLHARAEAATGRPLKDADQVWRKSADILIAERLWTITHRVLAVGFDKPVLGNTWWALKTDISPEKRKALLFWLNSTLGLLLFYGRRVVTRGPWVQMKKPAWLAMPTLDVRCLEGKDLYRLAAAYDELAGQELLALSKLAEDPVRKAIDDVLSEVLGLPDLGPIREMLGQEPGLTGQAIIIKK